MSNNQRLLFDGFGRLEWNLSDPNGFVWFEKGDSQTDFLVSTKLSNRNSGSIDFLIPELIQGICWYCYGPVYAWVVPKRLDKFSGSIERIQFLMLQYVDGTYAAIFPISEYPGVSQFFFDNQALKVSLDNLSEVAKVPILAISFNTDPYLAVQKVIDFGLHCLDRPIIKKGYPDFFKLFGWCSWNAFGHDVDHSRLIYSAKSFIDKGLPLKWMLLDDGWMDITGDYGTGKLRSFMANPIKFPFGLSGLINELKSKFMVEKVGVWLTLSGYWGGIEMDSDLFVNYKSSFISFPYKVAWSSSDISNSCFSVAIDVNKGIFEEWFRLLKSEGVDFVKIDHQNILDEFRKNISGQNYIKEWLKSIVELCEDVFGEGNIIHCMGMVPNAYLNTEGKGVTRISEDYFPQNFTYNPLAGNGAVHAVNNFTTAVWMQHLANVDADMFQSDHPHAYYHAAIRFLMGGLIYTTDYPGNQISDVYFKLVDWNGSLRRIGNPAQPIPKCLFQLYDPLPYIVFAKDDEVFYVGIFNVADVDRVYGTWSCDDIPYMNGDLFRISDWMTGEVLIIEKTKAVTIELGRMGFQLFIIEKL